MFISDKLELNESDHLAKSWSKNDQIADKEKQDEYSFSQQKDDFKHLSQKIPTFADDEDFKQNGKFCGNII